MRKGGGEEGRRGAKGLVKLWLRFTTEQKKRKEDAIGGGTGERGHAEGETVCFFFETKKLTNSARNARYKKKHTCSVPLDGTSHGVASTDPHVRAERTGRPASPPTQSTSAPVPGTESRGMNAKITLCLRTSSKFANTISFSLNRAWFFFLHPHFFLGRMRMRCPYEVKKNNACVHWPLNQRNRRNDTQ